MITKNGQALAERLLCSNKGNARALDNSETIKELCSRLCRHAATLQRLAETACNRELTTSEQSRDANAEAHCRIIVAHLFAAGCTNVVRPSFDGDPRGAIVKLQVDDESGDWFGGRDYVVVK